MSKKIYTIWANNGDGWSPTDYDSLKELEEALTMARYAPIRITTEMLVKVVPVEEQAPEQEAEDE